MAAKHTEQEAIGFMEESVRRDEGCTLDNRELYAMYTEWFARQHQMLTAQEFKRIFQKHNNISIGEEGWSGFRFAYFHEFGEGRTTSDPQHKHRSAQDRIAEFLEERVSAREGYLLRKNAVAEEFKAWHSGVYGRRAPAAHDLFKQITKKYGEFNKKEGGWRNVQLSYGDDTPQMEMKQT